jgi:hypothetical protein
MHRNGTENGVDRWRCAVVNIERFHDRCATDPKYRLTHANDHARRQRRRTTERLARRVA